MQQRSPKGHRNPAGTLIAPPVHLCLQSCNGTDSQSGGGDALPDGEIDKDVLALLEAVGVIVGVGLLEIEGVIDTETLLDAVGVAELLTLVDTDGVTDTLMLAEEDEVIVGEGLELGFGQHISPAFSHLNNVPGNGASPPGHFEVTAQL